MTTITQGLGFFPFCLSLLLVLAITISYIISQIERDVEPFLPSVSKTAAFQPEGSIFAQFLDTIAFVGLINVFLRFLQVEMMTSSLKEKRAGFIYKLRVSSLTFGIATMVGVTIAGNFRFPANEVRIYVNRNAGTVMARSQTDYKTPYCPGYKRTDELDGLNMLNKNRGVLTSPKSTETQLTCKIPEDSRKYDGRLSGFGLTF